MKYAKFKGSGEHYFAIADKANENGLYEGISVSAGQQKSLTTCSMTGRWFGTMYEACTKKEFDAAYDLAMKVINEKRNSIV